MEERRGRGAKQGRAAVWLADGRAPKVWRALLGDRLREQREAAGLNKVQDVAALIDIDPQKLRRLEQAKTGADAATVRRLLGAYLPRRRFSPAAQRTLEDELVTLAQKAAEPGWWARKPVDNPASARFSLEDAATVIRTYQHHTIPELLQTPDYAVAWLRATQPNLTKEDIDLEVELLQLRQERLKRKDAAPGVDRLETLRCLLDEAALTVHPGGPIPAPVMQRQLVHLVTAMADDPRIDIRVIQATMTPHPLTIRGPVVNFSFGPRELTDVVHTRGFDHCYSDKEDEVKAVLQDMDHTSSLHAMERPESEAYLHDLADAAA